MSDENVTSDATLNADLAATSAHAEVSLAASAEHERYSLLVLGFTGALATFLVDAEVAGAARMGAVASGGASLLVGFCSTYIGHALAQARTGATMKTVISDAFEVADVPEEVRERAVVSMLNFQSALHWPWDRYLLRPLLDGATPWKQRYLRSSRRMIRLCMWQSKLMRLQLFGAAIATGFLLWGAVP